MNLLVWGLGYVGSVSSACFSKIGFKVTGIDKDKNKIKLFNSGICPIDEPDVENLLVEAGKNNLFNASAILPKALDEYECSLICVGTPSKENGEPDLSFLKSVCKDIGSLLINSNKFHNVIIRSTVFPGTTRNILKNIIEDTSGKKVGVDFGIVMNPEFLREATAVKDFFNPPYTILGGYDSNSTNIASKLYESIKVDIYNVKIEEAEILKMVNNAFHAMKISFANEIGRICDKLEIDSNKIMGLVCEDKKLNISEKYLKPGFAFGGSCLPKDLMAINHFGDSNKIKLSLLNNILDSNDEHIDFIIDKIKADNNEKIGILGLSFKSGTDDLRESPTIKMVKKMLEKGFKIKIYDNKIDLSKIFGSNKLYLEKMIPSFKNIFFKNLDEIIEDCSTIIIANDDISMNKHIKKLSSIKVINLSDLRFSD